MRTLNFGHNKMLQFSIALIQDFAANHQEEIFYGFYIDGSLLCLNSEQRFAECLSLYQSEYPGDYLDGGEVPDLQSTIQDLRMNAADWEYHGFADLEDSGGFNQCKYGDRINIQEGISSYRLAMQNLIAGLIGKDAFADLRTTDDFFVNIAGYV
jgi:hypothetical protein